MKNNTRIGITLGLAAFVAAGLIVTSGQFVPPQPPSGGGGGTVTTVGPGLQGNGSPGSPLDIKHGTADGQTVAWNGSQWTIGSYCTDPSMRWCVSDNFTSYSAACGAVNYFGSATGGSCSQQRDTTHVGIGRMQTGTVSGTTGSRMSSQTASGGQNAILFGGLAFTSVALVREPVLGAAGNDYIHRFGFGEWSSVTANNTNAVQAVYDHATNGNVWAIETRAAGVSTVTKCDGAGGTVNKPIVAGTWYVVTLNVNAAATSATISVDGTVCATNTTNIPTAAGVNVGAQCTKNGGGIDYACDFDWLVASAPI